MTHPTHSARGGDLLKQVGDWLRREEDNQELKGRIASALDDIRGFVDRQRSDIEKRKGRLIQTSGFKGETRGMEAAIANIHQQVTGGRNVSSIFAAIDGFLDTYKADDSLAREHTRVQLADAREDFACAFHESVRGSRLGDLLDVLHFAPYSCWRSRGVERRNFRSPSASEVLTLLQELGHRGIDVDSLETSHLAAIIRLKLGITPRMDYHLMSSNKLAGQLTSEETISRVASREVPLDARLSRTVGRMLADIRRWSAECFEGASVPAPAEIEAEMLQILFCCSDTLRTGGSENERAADYLWLLSTVVAGTRSPLRDALAGLAGKDLRYPSVRRRIVRAASYLDEIAVLTDRSLTSRWPAARDELDSLTALAEAIASKSAREFGEFTELEQLKEKRSDAVKSLIKISDSLQLVEPSLLDLLAAPDVPSMHPAAAEHLRSLDPARLQGRNLGIAEETRSIARQELEKLRLLIARITAISRKGLADSAGQHAQGPSRPGMKASRRTAGGADLAGMSDAELQARLGDLLRRVALCVRECRGRVEGARKRTFKIDLQHALNVFGEKLRIAAECCDGSDLDAVDGARAPQASDRIAPLLGDVMSAQTHVNTRVVTAKLTPAEKQPLVALLFSVKTRIGDDLRELERLRAELADRSAEVPGGTDEEAAVPGDSEDAPCETGGSQEEPVGSTGTEQGGADEVPTGTRLASFASAANSALKPVKDLMVRLNDTISSGGGKSREMLAAAHALVRGVAEARDLVTWNRIQFESLATERGVSADRHLDKFDRWDGQLIALGRETERLVEAGERAAATSAACQAAAALEKEVSDSIKE